MHLPDPLPAAATRLPVWRLLALTLAGFIAIVTETLPAGLLPQISHGLSIDQAMAGQLISVYALGSVVAAIPLIAATRSWRRRPLLLLAIGGLLLCNSLTALSTHYGVTLVVRFAAGMAAGLVWGLLAGYARRLVVPALQGRALAVMGVGQPLALCLGVPLGTWLGTWMDWQWVFWSLSLLALVLWGWVRLAVPDHPGQQAGERQPVLAIFLTPGIAQALLVIFVWILAHNILYTYIAPFLESLGLAAVLDRALLLFGLASLLGIWGTGLLVDRWLRGLTLCSLAGFALASLLLGIAGQQPWLVWPAIVAWGLTFGGAPTLLQTAVADAAGEGADVAQSMLVTIFNLGIAGGGVVGGLLLQSQGALSFPWVMAALAVVGLVLVWGARSHAFKPGQRLVCAG
ncbi:MFS transporter [Pseudomonas sp. L5B5]|uniref:MFS transporter n=1 Tax=Pseudomonas sp. L5B5 TaxID=2883205 RepID=UPI00072FA81A|nr:MFS transporter [Pseudomonas sp. L5B5]KTC39429.1 MFS transporter [Pseudomonas sp. ABAC61]UCZ85524.1 MFS transporter [Pseudomonas sp. L5B5]